MQWSMWRCVVLIINSTGFPPAQGPCSALGQSSDLISFGVMFPLENIAPPPEGIQASIFMWQMILSNLGSLILGCSSWWLSSLHQTCMLHVWGGLMLCPAVRDQLCLHLIHWALLPPPTDIKPEVLGCCCYPVPDSDSALRRQPTSSFTKPLLKDTQPISPP